MRGLAVSGSIFEGTLRGAKGAAAVRAGKDVAEPEMKKMGSGRAHFSNVPVPSGQACEFSGAEKMEPLTALRASPGSESPPPRAEAGAVGTAKRLAPSTIMIK